MRTLGSSTLSPGFRHVYRGGSEYGVVGDFSLSGTLIRDFRVAQDWSQDQLAQKLGLNTRGVVSSWEQGRRVPLEYACKLRLFISHHLRKEYNEGSRPRLRTSHVGSSQPDLPSRMGIEWDKPRNPNAYLAVIVDGNKYKAVWGDVRRREGVHRDDEIVFAFTATSGKSEEQLVEDAQREAKRRGIQVEDLAVPGHVPK